MVPPQHGLNEDIDLTQNELVGDDAWMINGKPTMMTKFCNPKRQLFMLMNNYIRKIKNHQNGKPCFARFHELIIKRLATSERPILYEKDMWL